MTSNGNGSRLRFAREKWAWSPAALSARSGVDVATIRQIEARTVDDEGDERSCPFCEGRGFTWDYDAYDGFYALCTHCDGSGHFVIVEPDRLAIRKLAHALHVYPEWLDGDDVPMVPIWEMTVESQHAAHNGPSSEGLPGYVVIEPGGPWYRDADGEWAVDGSAR
jgi:hypothetical protein